MSKSNDKMFIVIRAPISGEIVKLEVSKFHRDIQRGLKEDYGLRSLPLHPDQIGPHKCPVCSKNCKADNGTGTRAALEIERFGLIHQNIMKVLAIHDPATLDEIRLYLDVEHDQKTSANALHSRISELAVWRLVESINLEGPTHETGTKFAAGPAVAYKLDRRRAEIVEKDDWQTWRLIAMDNGASFVLEGFAA